ncbi:hypothetical protein GINT2_000061 [Glugoides intestinalis]
MRTDTYEKDESEFSEKIYEDLWVLKFMNERQNRYLERIQDSFLQDRFNFYGLKEKVADFESAYLAIQDQKESKDFENEAMLYLLAHQRYIFTRTGADNVLDRVLNKEYGLCRHYGCKNIPLIPIGLSNQIGDSSTMTYCHNCNNLFEPRGSLKKLDGAAWGTSFAHFLVLSYSYQFKKTAIEEYIPRVFGFRVSEPEENDSE